MSQLSKQALVVDNNQSFPNNNAGAITPSILRAFNTNMIDSTVNQTVYTADSSSWNAQIAAISSSATPAVTSSLLVTASFANTNITFTKGDATTFSLKGFAITGSNTFTGSQIINAGGQADPGLTISGSLNTLGNLNVYGTSNFISGASTVIRGNSFNVQDSAGTNKFFVSNTVELVRSLYPLEVQASFTASLTQGYAWIGGAGNVSTLVATSSFGTSINTGSFVTTSSFNAYTSSQLTINTAIGVSTASLNTATASLFTSASLGLTTASFSGNTLTFTKGNGTTFGVVIPDISGSTINTGSFATTGSNSFVGNQRITGSLFMNNAVAPGGVVIEISGSGGELVHLINNGVIQLRDSGSARINTMKPSEYSLRSGSTSLTILAGNESIGTLYNINNRPSIVLSSGSATSGYYPAIEFQDALRYTDGRVTIKTPLSASAGFTASLQNGYAWVGNSLGENTQVLTSSFAGATINTGSFATTGSNLFNGNQLVTNGALQVASYNETSPQFYGPVVFQGVGTASVAYDHFVNAGNFDALHIESNLNAGTIFQDYGGGLNTWLSIPTNTGNNPAPIMGRGLVVTGSTQIQNFTASLQQGYVYVGNSSGRTTTVATSSFGTPIPTGTISGSSQITALGFVSSSVTASSLVTASFSGNTLTFTKGDASTFGVVIPDVSGSAGSFVTTSSFNAYTASVTQSIVTATVTNVGSQYYQIDGIQAPKLSFVPGPTYRFDLSGIVGSHPFKFSTTANGPTEYTTGVTSGSNFIQIEVGYDTTTPLYYYCTNHNGMGNEINVLGIDKLVTTASFNAYTASQSTGSLMTTGSVSGNVLTFTKADASTFSLTVATGSGGGGAAFPYTGSAEITGSLGITGSFRGYVNTLSVASSTASIDMNNGNFFTLNLPTSSTTHITMTNIKAGQTINLQVSQSSANTGSIAFAPNIKFAGGFDYTTTPITGALDLVSFITFDAVSIIATSVKNLL